MASWQSLVVDIYFAILAVLSLYGLHRYVILYLFHRHHKRAVKRFPPPGDGRRPTVTVQLPLFNERYVARRVIEAAGRLRYPPDRLRIQILDDSTDSTRDIVMTAAQALRARGIRVDVIHRDVREGFKAGALAAGLEATDDDLVAVFDADFVPPEDFLEKTVPHFQDARVGMVQTRWTYLNRDYSLLTRLQALLLDGHFLLEHTARDRSGRYFNFNGTAGVFRRAAIIDAGGWEGDTLTEDLDLSYRTQLRGWKFVFLPDVECPSELPVDIFGLKNQQQRWTKGSIQVGRKLLPRIWRARIPLVVKLEATVHLTANLTYLLLVALSALMPVAVVVRARALTQGTFVFEAALFGMTTASIFVFYLVALREAGSDWRLRARDIPLVLAAGVGMCINNAWAVTEALAGRRSPFVRTAKYRIESMRDGWKEKRYRSSRMPAFYVECLFAAYTLGAFAVIAWMREWAALPYVSLFVAGYVYVSGVSVRHARR